MPVSALALLVLVFVRARPLDAQGQGAANEFNDSHFHLTNYIQEGIDVRDVPRRSWARASGASTLFGIPLQQQWSYANSGDFAPTYYLQTDAPLYYYSFTDAYIAMRVPRAVPKEQQARFDPMITGFNPADMYARRSHPPRAEDVSRRLHRHRRVHASTRSSCRRRSPARPPA